MKVPDLNVLVSAFRQDHPFHGSARAWLENTLAAGDRIGLSTVVATGSVRLLTLAAPWTTPDTTAEALQHLDMLRAHPSVIDLAPGPRHWSIFSDLCRSSGARGNVVADAAHAALAIEHGATWITFDRDFGRFRGLRWEVPGE